MSVPLIKLNDGNKIPQVGLGLWQSKDKKLFKEAVHTAIQVDYRHFDTAQAYKNEQMLGSALKDSDQKRQDVFITTKIFISHFRPKTLRSSFNESLSKLQTDYVDLLLLHFPVPLLRKRAWLELEKIKQEGAAKSIGVSNYTIRHIKEMDNYANIVPAINQVELHVFLQQPELRKFCLDRQIQVEAYSPLARAKILDNPVIAEIAKKHSKSYGQIMLRWLIEQGLVIIPKSVTPKRIAENIDLFNFKLDSQDIARLNKLDMNKRFCWSAVRVP